MIALKSMILRSQVRAATYKLDVRKVDPGELSVMCRVFRKMNFDSSVQLTGV